MRLLTKWAQASDEEYVEKARRKLTRFERWRPWLIGLYVFNLMLLVGGASVVVLILQSVWKPGDPPLLWAGLVVGCIIGAWLGEVAYQVGHGLATGLFGLRNERLLVKYHDELQSVRRADAGHE
jgi:hypothetical protein